MEKVIAVFMLYIAYSSSVGVISYASCELGYNCAKSIIALLTITLLCGLLVVSTLPIG